MRGVYKEGIGMKIWRWFVMDATLHSLKDQVEAADGSRAGVVGRGWKLRSGAEDAAVEQLLGQLRPSHGRPRLQHGCHSLSQPTSQQPFIFFSIPQTALLSAPFQTHCSHRCVGLPSPPPHIQPLLQQILCTSHPPPTVSTTLFTHPSLQTSILPPFTIHPRLHKHEIPR